MSCIYVFLETDDLIALSRTCKRWNIAVRNEDRCSSGRVQFVTAVANMRGKSATWQSGWFTGGVLMPLPPRQNLLQETVSWLTLLPPSTSWHV